MIGYLIFAAFVLMGLLQGAAVLAEFGQWIEKKRRTRYLKLIVEELKIINDLGRVPPPQLIEAAEQEVKDGWFLLEGPCKST